VQAFRGMLETLSPAVLKLHPGFDVSGRTGRNFSRINRDIRFAKDKTPYRTQMYLTFSDAAATDGDDAQLYVGASAEAVTVGFRMYHGGREARMARVTVPRALANAKWLAAQARRLGQKYESYWYTSEKNDWTKHNGWPVDAADWKRVKGWIVRKKLRPAGAARPGFLRDAGKILRELFPLYAFASLTGWTPRSSRPQG